MALASAIQGSRHTAQSITWITADGNPLDLTGATIVGVIRDISGVERAIDGIITITDAAGGSFTWTYGETDVAESGVFDVQFTATYASTLFDRSLIDRWYVAPAIGEAYSSIISAVDYPAVRAAIDISLITQAGSRQILSDDVISLSIYQGAAEAYVQTADPDYATRTGAELQALKNAVIFLTAANLVPAIPFLNREDFGDYNYSRFIDKTFQDKLITSLRSRANTELNAVLGLDIYAAMPPMFDVAQGRRGA